MTINVTEADIIGVGFVLLWLLVCYALSLRRNRRPVQDPNQETPIVEDTKAAEDIFGSRTTEQAAPPEEEAVQFDDSKIAQAMYEASGKKSTTDVLVQFIDRLLDAVPYNTVKEVLDLTLANRKEEPDIVMSNGWELAIAQEMADRLREELPPQYPRADASGGQYTAMPQVDQMSADLIRTILIGMEDKFPKKEWKGVYWAVLHLIQRQMTK